MLPALYDTLVPWYALLDPRDDHEDEAALYTATLSRVVTPSPRTLLELGAGAGNNASFLKRAFECTLTDVSEPMLGLSRAQNAECEHLLGDMRSLRLGRTFDAVLIHDAIVYMCTEADLRAAIETAFIHTRPGGAAIFAPDCVRETFHELTQLHGQSQGERGLHALEWSWDPDPSDTTYTVDWAFLARHGAEMTAIHDRHVEGLFPRAQWIELITSVGFEVESVQRPLEDEDTGSGYVEEIFVGRRLG